MNCEIKRLAMAQATDRVVNEKTGKEYETMTAGRYYVAYGGDKWVIDIDALIDEEDVEEEHDVDEYNVDIDDGQWWRVAIVGKDESDEEVAEVNVEHDEDESEDMECTDN